MTTRAKQHVSAGMLMTLMLASCSAPNAGKPAPSTPTTSVNSSSDPTAPAQPTAPSQSSASSSHLDTMPTQSQQPSPREQAEALANELSVSEQASSLVMAGVPATGASAAEGSALKEQGISNEFLRGRAHLSVKQ